MFQGSTIWRRRREHMGILPEEFCHHLHINYSTLYLHSFSTKVVLCSRNNSINGPDYSSHSWVRDNSCVTKWWKNNWWYFTILILHASTSKTIFITKNYFEKFKKYKFCFPKKPLMRLLLFLYSLWLIPYFWFVQI